MKKINGIIALLMISWSITAQDLEFEDYKWEKDPKLTELSKEDAEKSELILLSEISTEFAFEDQNSFYAYYFFHRKIRLNSDDAIEANNKIYIPTGGVIEVLATKARVINSKGEIKELDKNDIKVAEDEESKVSYQYFALEGIDVGSEIEYFFYLKEYPELTGTRINLQTDVPIKELQFSLICPKQFEFQFKSYNGFPEVVEEEDFSEEKYKWSANVQNVPELKDEPMSAYSANKQFVIYKLYANNYTNKRNLNSFSTISQSYFERINPEYSKSTLKSIKSLIKSAGVASIEPLEKKIRKLEDYLKINYNNQTFAAPELSNLDFILENKIANKTGMMKLYVACLNYLEIEHQIVLGSDRFKNKFDKDFESYSFLVDEMLYFKSIDKYLSPNAVFSRLGYLPSNWTNNYGLFIKPIKLGDFVSALGKVRFIEPLPHELSSDTLDIIVDFTEDISNPKISYTKSQKGLEIMGTQPIYDYIEGEDEDDLDEQVAKFMNQDIDVEDVKIENKGGDNFGVKSFKVSAKLKDTDAFIEKAGTKYLFKVGELIGPQMEMYQEDGQERIMDVEMVYNHSYYRTIKFNIPEGYKINNLEDINFDVKFEFEGEVNSSFTSSYTQNNNEVIISNEEIYDQLNYPKEYFSEYQKVINAAADFNKITFVIEKL